MRLAPGPDTSYCARADTVRSGRSAAPSATISFYVQGNRERIVKPDCGSVNYCSFLQEKMESLDISDESEDQDLDDEVPRKKTKYVEHKYREEWKVKFPWISSSCKGVHHFYCKACSRDYVGGHSAVQKHAGGVKHVANVKALKSQTTLLEIPAVSTFRTKNVRVKTAEIRLASFIAEHNIAFNAVDHLVQIVRDLPADAAVLKEIKCNRTKCTNIVKNVIGKENLEYLTAMMNSKKFSILIDESTDVSSVKSLALCVRFVVDCKPRDYFLDLLPVPDARAEPLYQVITSFFSHNKIDYKSNMIGFGADGANVMMGRNHSVQSLLKEEIPNLWVSKCICHSLAICASKACMKLPRTPETLLR